MTPEQQKRWFDFFEDARAHLESNPRTLEDVISSLEAISYDAQMAANCLRKDSGFQPLKVREFKYEDL